MAIKTASNSQWQNLANRVKDIDDLHSPLVPNSRDKAIPANADLNTPEYLAIGTYYCASANTGNTLVNAPEKSALSMRVYNPISTQKGSESTSTWVYRYREVICLNGNTYKQIVTSGSTAGQFTYGPWKKIATHSDFKTINSTSILGSGDITVQPTLVSGTNIKTVNNTSLLGSGNVSVQPTLVSGTNIKTVGGTSLLGSGNVPFPTVDASLSDTSTNAIQNKAVNTALAGKQATLVSGTNIKTVNSTSLLGSGNVAVQPTLVSGTNIKTVNNTSLLGSGNIAVQPTLVSGTNIKTVNGNSLLGSGNIEAGGTPTFACSRLTSKDTETEVAVKVDLAGKNLVAGMLCIFNFTESVRVNKTMKLYFYNGNTDTGISSTPYLNRVHYVTWNPDELVWVNSGKQVLIFVSSVDSTSASTEVLQASTDGAKRSGFLRLNMNSFNQAINNVKWLTINTNTDSSFNPMISWDKYDSTASTYDSMKVPDSGSTVQASINCRILGTWAGVIRIHVNYYSKWGSSVTTSDTQYIDVYKPAGTFYLSIPAFTHSRQYTRIGIQAVNNTNALEVDSIYFTVGYDYATGRLG